MLSKKKSFFCTFETFENVWSFSLIFTAELKSVLFKEHFASFFVTYVFIL